MLEEMVRPVAYGMRHAPQLDAYQPRHTGLIRLPDNHMINGTKLLNVAGMTRGRRDGILKSEKTRHVVKIGPMHLKGVWYEAAESFSMFLTLIRKQDTFRPSPGLCQQGENYRVIVSFIRAQYWGSSISPYKSEQDECGDGCS